MAEEKGLSGLGDLSQLVETLSMAQEAQYLEERVLRVLDRLAASGRADPRWFSIGRTDIEKGFMAIRRSVFQAGRLALPEDAAQ